MSRPLSLLSSSTLCFLIFLPYALSSSLNCTFERECCWESRNGETPWKISRIKMPHAEFRRTFRSERNKMGPKGYFLSQTIAPRDKTTAAQWSSCPFCSESGLVEVHLRIWQSPTSHVSLCWETVDTPSMRGHCITVRVWKHEYHVSYFATPRFRQVRLYVTVENRSVRSNATVFIDRILVWSDFCRRPVENPKRILKSHKAKAKSANPFVEIFGDDFAEFLVSDTDDIKSNSEKERRRGPPLFTRTTQEWSPEAPMRTTVASWSKSEARFRLTTSTSPPPPSFTCDTVGGCLFDRSMCTYRNSKLNHNAFFARTSVLSHQFAHASMPSGGVAVIESATHFDTDHRIYFDYLEFSEGEKLSVCCFKPKQQPSELRCPFQSALRRSAIEWHSANVLCSAGTTKILFICENYGRRSGSCSLDNVRLHRSTDIFELEPCQKHVLPSL